MESIESSPPPEPTPGVGEQRRPTKPRTGPRTARGLFRAPHTRAELLAAFRSPLCAIDLVLTERQRLVATAGDHPLLLMAVLLFVSVVFTLPYGLVVREPWRITVLYVGSVAICWPSLHVFGCYLGLALHATNTLILALCATAVASLFTFGFFPILWFLRETVHDGAATAEAARVTWTNISVGLLALALLAGLAQLSRCLVDQRSRELPSVPPSLLLGWQGLVVFICHRMAVALELM